MRLRFDRRSAHPKQRRRARLRTPIAVVCIAVAIFAACVPSIVLIVPVGVLAPARLSVHGESVVRLPGPELCGPERTAPLLRLLPTRAPPARGFTA